jgi:photosystem I subunit 4
VKILRRESYWYNGIGNVVTVDQVNYQLTLR